MVSRKSNQALNRRAAETRALHGRKGAGVESLSSGTLLRRRILPPLLLFLVILATYVPTLKSQFIYDDVQVILVQKAPHTFADIARIFAERHFPNLPYYRPVTRTTLLLQKTLHGDRAAYFHLANTLLAGVAALLVSLLLRLPAFAVRTGPAWLASALYGLHPIAASCVNPVSSGRETLLPTTLTIGALYAFLKPGRGWRISSFALLAAAIFSKEQAVIAPFLFALADVLRLAPDPPGKDLYAWLRKYWPLAPLLGIYFAARLRLFGAWISRRGA
jgi:hypothetical protein